MADSFPIAIIAHGSNTIIRSLLMLSNCLLLYRICTTPVQLLMYLTSQVSLTHIM